MERFEYIAVIILAAALFGGLVVWAVPIYSPPPEPPQKQKMRTLGEAIRLGAIKRPPSTEKTTTKALAKTKGFQALVSYTDFGFEPKTVTIKQGETIRFTNNSSNDLHLRVFGKSGDTLTPQEFTEVTFDVKGEWTHTNDLDVTRGGVVRVE